jgi:oligoribonuclease NrnB/cAMP/cGMP phosphodiesterase (DHH superfamily)
MAATIGNGGGHPNASGGKIENYKDSFVYTELKEFIQNYIEEKSKEPDTRETSGSSSDS